MSAVTVSGHSRTARQIDIHHVFVAVYQEYRHQRDTIELAQLGHECMSFLARQAGLKQQADPAEGSAAPVNLQEKEWEQRLNRAPYRGHHLATTMRARLGARSSV